MVGAQATRGARHGTLTRLHGLDVPGHLTVHAPALIGLALLLIAPIVTAV